MVNPKGSTKWEPHRDKLVAGFRAGRSFVNVADELRLSRDVVDRLFRRWKGIEGRQPYARHYITAGSYSVACDPEHARREAAEAARHGPVTEVVRHFVLEGQTIREVRQ